MKRIYPRGALIAAMLFIFSGCDSGSSDSIPAINSIIVGDDPVVFIPGETPPETTLRAVLNGSSDGLTANWTADGGSFSSSGTQTVTSDASSPVLWSPDPLGGSYGINVTVTDGSSDVMESRTIEVEPSIADHWLGTIDVSDESADRAGFCMWIRDTNELGDYEYGQTLGSAGGASGGTDIASTYDFPVMALDFNASGQTGGIDPDEAVSAVGTIDADGLRIEVVVVLGNGTMRTIPLERYAGTCDDLDNEIRSQ